MDRSVDDLGHAHFRIARYNNDGSTDLTFNSGSGSIFAVFGTSYDVLTNIRLQTDGKIVAAGQTNLNPASEDIELIRINTDGTIDNSFGNTGNGLVLADINSDYDESDFLVIQQDGKIITGGNNANFTSPFSNTFSCFRFNADGKPDAGFGTDGNFIDFILGAYYSYGSLFLQGDGKLLAVSNLSAGAKSESLISRFNIDGTPDNTYGQNGTHALLSSIGISSFQPDEKLLVAEYSSTNSGDIWLARYNPDGTPDATFGNGGVAITDFGGDESPGVISFQPDGKIIIGGLWRDNNGSDLLIVRYNTDGSVDGSFGNGGYVRVDFGNEDQVLNISVAPDGKIVFSGQGSSSRLISVTLTLIF